jgi:hypothetical protein
MALNDAKTRAVGQLNIGRANDEGALADPTHASGDAPNNSRAAGRIRRACSESAPCLDACAYARHHRAPPSIRENGGVGGHSLPRIGKCSLDEDCIVEQTTIRLEPMSYCTFTRRCKKADSIRAREGSRAEYQKKPIAQSLDQRYAVHGLLPHTAIHFDHTTACMAMTDPFGADLGKPTMSVGFDACTGHARALIYSFDPECTKAALLLLRDYVRRWGRFPRCLILDNGSPFHSAELAAFCAYFGIDIIWRDPHEPRGGAIVERNIGSIEQEVLAQQDGNTIQVRDNRLPHVPLELNRGVSFHHQARSHSSRARSVLKRTRKASQ